MTNSDGLDESPLTGDNIDDKELEKILVYDDYEYKQKCKLGSQVEKLINKNGIRESKTRVQIGIRPTSKEKCEIIS